MMEPLDKQLNFDEFKAAVTVLNTALSKTMIDVFDGIRGAKRVILKFYKKIRKFSTKRCTKFEKGFASLYSEQIV